MALSVSGFPEPLLRQLDTDDNSLSPLQRGLNLFAKKRQNTDNFLSDWAPPELSPISPTDDFAQMAILQPPPMDVIPPSLSRPRKISLTHRTPQPPPQRQPAIGRLEIGSVVPKRPSLPKLPSSAVVQETQPPLMAHPRPLPVVPVPVPQGPIIESSKSAALRAAAMQSAGQPQPRVTLSRNATAGPSRPRAATTGAHYTGALYQPLAVDPTETPGISSSSPTSTPALSPTPTPQDTHPTTTTSPSASAAPSGPRPLPRIPPASTAPIASPGPIPTASPSAAVVTSHIQPPYVPCSSRVKRPKTSPSSSAGFGNVVRSPFDAVPSSWVSRPIDLHPSGLSGSGSASASSSNARASGSGSNGHVTASGSGSNSHVSGSGPSSSASGSGSASGSSSRPRSLPRPRSHSRSRDQSAEASSSGSRSRGAASPIRRIPLATGSTSPPLPSSPGPTFVTGFASGSTVTPPGSRRASAASNTPTPRSSINPGAIVKSSPRASPRIPSLPPPPKAISRALPSPTKITDESAITSVKAMTFTTHAPSRLSASASTTGPPSAPTTTTTAVTRSHSVTQPSSILKNTKTRTPTRTRTLQLHNHLPETQRSSAHKSLPPEPINTNLNRRTSVNTDGSMIITDASSFVSRSPSPMRYAPGEDIPSDDETHPDHRSRSRNRPQLLCYRRSYRHKPANRSPSPIAYAKRSSIEMGDADLNGVSEDDDDDDDDFEFVGGMQKQRRHTQPRSYRFDYAGSVEEGEKKKKEGVWRDFLGRKDSKDSKETKDAKENKDSGLAWDAVWAVGSGLVRKRSKSKIGVSQAPSRDSFSGNTANRHRSSVIDISPSSPSISPSISHLIPNHAPTSNRSIPSLNSRDNEDVTVDSHGSNSKESDVTNNSRASKKRQRSLALPYTTPVDSSPFSVNTNLDLPVRTRTSSDVSQQRPRHTRVKSDLNFGGRGQGQGQGQTHKARLSGVLPGIAWGAEVNTDRKHRQWDERKKLAPVRRDMGGVLDTEKERGKAQGPDMDVVKALHILRRLKARS